MDEFEELLSWIEDPKNSQSAVTPRESRADHLDDFDKMFQQMSSVQKSAGKTQDPRISMLLQDLGQEMEYEKKKQNTISPTPKAAASSPKAQAPRPSAEDELANDLIAQLLGPSQHSPAQPGTARTLSQQLQRDAESLARELEEEALTLSLKQPAAPYVAAAPAPRTQSQAQPVVDIHQLEIERQNKLRLQQIEQAKARAAAQRAQAEASKPGATALFLCPGCQLPGGMFKEENGVAYCSLACAKMRFKRR